MQKQALNYRIFIRPEKAGKKIVYIAYCPTLNIKDYGNSVEEALKVINYSIKSALEDLVRKKQEIIGDNIYNQILTTVQIKGPIGIKTAPAY